MHLKYALNSLCHGNWPIKRIRLPLCRDPVLPAFIAGADNGSPFCQKREREREKRDKRDKRQVGGLEQSRRENALAGGQERPWGADGARACPGRRPLRRPLLAATPVPHRHSGGFRLKGTRRPFPFSICLSFLVCRERRISPDRADPGCRAVLKVQNLLNT